MLFQNRIFDLEIDRMKIPKLVVIFSAVSILFLFLLLIGTFGPKKLVIDDIPNVFCENDLIFGDELEKPQSNHASTENSETYKCIFWKDFSVDQSSKIMNFRLEIYTAPEYIEQFEELETRFNISVFESNRIETPSDNLTEVSNRVSFPLVDTERLEQLNRQLGSKGAWTLILNDFLFNGVPVCGEKVQGIEKSKCVIDVYGDMDLSESSQKLAIMLGFPLSEKQKEKIDGLNFYLIYNNTAFYNFIFSYQVAISLASLAAFIYVIKKLIPYKTKDWLTIHKWILALLLTQAFLDNTFAILNDYFESKTLSVLSELGKNIHLTLLFYFWISVYDSILLQNMSESLFHEWAEKIKVTILTSFFILNFSFNLYVGIESIENDYKDLFELRILLNLIRFLITFLEVIYGLYFMILTILYVKMTHEGKIPIDTTSVVLFAFTFISFAMTTISLAVSPYSEGSFEYMAARGFIGIYTITVGILYVPHNSRIEQTSELDMTTMAEREQIIRNAYQDEGSEEEEKSEKSQESTEEARKKKLIWERIQKEVENEQQQETPTKEDSGDEEYIYL